MYSRGLQVLRHEHQLTYSIKFRGSSSDDDDGEGGGDNELTAVELLAVAAAPSE